MPPSFWVLLAGCPDIMLSSCPPHEDDPQQQHQQQQHRRQQQDQQQEDKDKVKEEEDLSGARANVGLLADGIWAAHGDRDDPYRRLNRALWIRVIIARGYARLFFLVCWCGWMIEGRFLLYLFFFFFEFFSPGDCEVMGSLWASEISVRLLGHSFRLESWDSRVQHFITVFFVSQKSCKIGNYYIYFYLIVFKDQRGLYKFD